jgi:hypothetical protein
LCGMTGLSAEQRFAINWKKLKNSNR